MNHIMSFALIFFLAVEMTSCKKDTSTTIVGKWNIVNDSTFLEGNALYAGRSSNYIGVPTDYFDFSSNGNLYVKKGTSLDTAAFTLLSGNKVQLLYFSVDGITFGPTGAIRGTYDITDLTERSVKLTLSQLTPEGQNLEIINLKK